MNPQDLVDKLLKKNDTKKAEEKESIKHYEQLAAKVEGSLESELNETREKIIYLGTQIKVFEGKIIS